MNLVITFDASGEIVSAVATYDSPATSEFAIVVPSVVSGTSSVDEFLNNFHNWKVVNRVLTRKSGTTLTGRAYTTAQWNALPNAQLPLTFERANTIGNFKVI